MTALLFSPFPFFAVSNASTPYQLDLLKITFQLPWASIWKQNFKKEEEKKNPYHPFFTLSWQIQTIPWEEIRNEEGGFIRIDWGRGGGGVDRRFLSGAQLDRNSIFQDGHLAKIRRYQEQNRCLGKISCSYLLSKTCHLYFWQMVIFFQVLLQGWWRFFYKVLPTLSQKQKE